MKILFDSNGPFESDSSNDFNGRKRSETMVQRYDKRSIVRNAIDPRQSVTVTRDALRYRIPDAIPVWLRTNTRVKINADTSLTGLNPLSWNIVNILVAIIYYIPIGQWLIIFDDYFQKIDKNISYICLNVIEKRFPIPIGDILI